jgi:hypothetical protein
MRVKNDNPAGAPGDYEWSGGDVVEVPDELAQEICAIPGGGFYAVEDEPTKPSRSRKTNTEVDPGSNPA